MVKESLEVGYRRPAPDVENRAADLARVKKQRQREEDGVREQEKELRRQKDKLGGTN